MSRLCILAGCALCASAALLSLGCNFAGKPPLPKRGSIERAGAPAAETDYAALAANADIIYFPRERAAFGGRSEPAARLRDALQHGAAPFAIAWDLIETGQQPLLDQWSAAPEVSREEMVSQLHLAGTGRAREHCRAVLRDRSYASVPQIALRIPSSLLGKLEAGEPLAPDERRQVPHGFDAPPDGLASYAERLAHTRAPPPARIAAAYGARLVRQQYAAERIVQHFRGAPSGTKLLAFIEGADLESGEGVPFYVAQKLPQRQLLFDSDSASRARTKLLTRTIRAAPPGTEIVDRAPSAARHQRGFLFPWPGAGAIVLVLLTAPEEITGPHITRVLFPGGRAIHQRSEFRLRGRVVETLGPEMPGIAEHDPAALEKQRMIVSGERREARCHGQFPRHGSDSIELGAVGQRVPGFASEKSAKERNES